MICFAIMFSVFINIGLLIAFLKLRKQIKKFRDEMYAYAADARVARDTAANTFAGLSGLFHEKFDKKEQMLDDTLKRAQTLSDTMIDAFYHRLDMAESEKRRSETK